MNCPACAARAANPELGILEDGCRQCDIFEIARGQPFRNSYWRRERLPEYVAQLVKLGDEEVVHREVLKVAKTLHMGAVRA